MEPITTALIAALAAGALAAAKDVTTTAIKDAYEGLKHLVTGKNAGAKEAITAIELAPEAKPKQIALAQQLEKTDLADDAELKAAIKKVLDAVDDLRSVPKAAALFDFEELRVFRNLEIKDVEAVGTIFRSKDAEIHGDLKIEGIRQTGESKKN